MRNLYSTILIVFFIFCIISTSIVLINRHNLAPSDSEISYMRSAFGSIEIRDSVDIFRVQNKVISEIKHFYVNDDNSINVQSIILLRKGLCYDRSIILQKIMLYNAISIRPVYFFFNVKRNKTSYIDFFGSEIDSHAAFEFKFNGKWYIMNSNQPMFELNEIDDYIINQKSIPRHSRYIRHLSNRNMRFVKPTWLPDIY